MLHPGCRISWHIRSELKSRISNSHQHGLVFSNWGVNKARRDKANYLIIGDLVTILGSDDLGLARIGLASLMHMTDHDRASTQIRDFDVR